MEEGEEKQKDYDLMTLDTTGNEDTCNDDSDADEFAAFLLLLQLLLMLIIRMLIMIRVRIWVKMRLMMKIFFN